MSYYFVLDDEKEFMTVQGPYSNKDNLIEGLNQSFGFVVFDSKREAKDYIEN